MDEPVSWLAIQAVKAAIGAIKIADGYRTDLGLAPIFTDRTQRNPEKNGAFVVVIATDFVPDTANSGVKAAATDMDLTVEYAIPTAMADPELLAHCARADLLRALGPNLRGFAAGFRTLTVTGSQITGAVEPGTQLVIAQVTARAGLSESLLPA